MPVRCLGSGNLFCSTPSSLGAVGTILGVLGTILLAGAIDGNLDCDFSALDLLAVHLGDSLLLQLLRLQGDEPKASALSWLVSGLELLDHESWDRSEGDLSGDRLVFVEKFLELRKSLASISDIAMSTTYLLFGQVIWQVCDHDLGGGRNTILWWTSLFWLTGLSWLVSSASLLVGLVGLVSQRKDLSRLENGIVFIGIARLATSATSGTTTTTTASATSASTCRPLSLSIGTFARCSLVWLASKLNRDLSFEDVFAREVFYGLVGIFSFLEIDKGVANRSAGSGIDRDRGRFAVAQSQQTIRRQLKIGKRRRQKPYSHIVAREELLEFRLSGRVSEIPNVQSATLSSTGRGGVSGCRVVIDAGLLQVISEIVDGRRHCG